MLTSPSPSRPLMTIPWSSDVVDLAIAAATAPRSSLWICRRATAFARSCAARAAHVHHDPFPQSGGVWRSPNRFVALARRATSRSWTPTRSPSPAGRRARERLEEESIAVWSRILAGLGASPSRLVARSPRRIGSGCSTSAPSRSTCHGSSARATRSIASASRRHAFDESLGRRPGWPLAMEENVLCDRARADGWRVVYDPRSVVRHRHQRRPRELALDVATRPHCGPRDALGGALRADPAATADAARSCVPGGRHDPVRAWRARGAASTRPLAAGRVTVSSPRQCRGPPFAVRRPRATPAPRRRLRRCGRPRGLCTASCHRRPRW